MIQRKLIIGIASSFVLLALLGSAMVSQHEGMQHEGMHEDVPVVSSSKEGAAEAGVWYCPMHTHVTSDHAGSCPVCGMNLVKREGASKTTRVAQFRVDPQVQERMGIVIETVQPMAFQPSLRVTAQVVADERRAVTLSPKVEGWVERLGVSVVGQRVRAGQVMYEIYSPELQQRQKDYLDLLTRRDSLLAVKGSDMASIGNSPPDLMLASVARERYRVRSRLLAADVPPAVLEDLERFRRIHDVVPVLAEHDGVVTSIGAREGGYVRPGEAVVSYADRNAAWAELSINPEMLGQLTNYDEVLLRSTVNSATVISAPVDAFLAVVDPVSRTARLRVPLPGTGDSFLPGTLPDAQIRMTEREALTLPADTIFRTGHGDFVIVAEASNHFRQAPVQLGAESNDRVEILGGIQPGERIVMNGQFMLSAESSLQSSWRRMAATQ